jgi:GNAT superfamily N-acetyltransferase
MASRPPTEGGCREAARILADAYRDDPVHRYTMRNVDRPERVAIPYFSRLIRTLRRNGREIHVSDDGASVAVWAPPGVEVVPSNGRVRYTPELIAEGPLAASIAVFDFAERLHPPDLHWYLELVGTVGDRQGQGAGSALVRRVLAHCDEVGSLAWTWSSNPRNLGFYDRLGFEIGDPVAVPDTPLTLHPVLRRPSARRR